MMTIPSGNLAQRTEKNNTFERYINHNVYRYRLFLWAIYHSKLLNNQRISPKIIARDGGQMSGLLIPVNSDALHREVDPYTICPRSLRVSGILLRPTTLDVQQRN